MAPTGMDSLGSIKYQVTFPKPYDRLIELITVISIAVFLIFPPLENKSYEYWLWCPIALTLTCGFQCRSLVGHLISQCLTILMSDRDNVST